jgi:hypothetical protein
LQITIYKAAIYYVPVTFCLTGKDETHETMETKISSFQIDKIVRKTAPSGRALFDTSFTSFYSSIVAV